MKKIQITNLSAEKFMSVGLFILTSIIMVALGSEATKNIAIISADETDLKIVFLGAIIGQAIIITWINASNELRYLIKKIRYAIIFFFFCCVLLTIYKNEKEILFSIFSSLIIFASGFILTLPNKKRKDKEVTVLNESMTYDDSVIFLTNGNRLVKRKITDYYYSAVEIDKDNKIVPDGQSYENVQAHWKNSPLIRVSKDGKYGFINRGGTIVIPIQFKMVSRFEDGNAMIVDENKSFFIDEKGETISALTIDFREI